MENPRLKPELCWTMVKDMEFVGGEIDTKDFEKKGIQVQTKIEADDEGYTLRKDDKDRGFLRTGEMRLDHFKQMVVLNGWTAVTLELEDEEEMAKDPRKKVPKI